MASMLRMPRLPTPTATRAPGLSRFARPDSSHRRRTSPGTSATVGCGAVCFSGATSGMSTGSGLRGGVGGSSGLIRSFYRSAVDELRGLCWSPAFRRPSEEPPEGGTPVQTHRPAAAPGAALPLDHADGPHPGHLPGQPGGVDDLDHVVDVLVSL